MQEIRQPFLRAFRVFPRSRYDAGVVYTDHEQSPVAIGECTQRPAEGAEVTESPLEFSMAVLSAFDAPQHFRPFHVRLSESEPLPPQLEGFVPPSAVQTITSRTDADVLCQTGFQSYQTGSPSV